MCKNEADIFDTTEAGSNPWAAVGIPLWESRLTFPTFLLVYVTAEADKNLDKFSANKQIQIDK